MKKNRISLFAILCLLLLSDCTNDQLPPPETGDCSTLQPTYENAVKEIIDRSCAYSGCHLNSAPGNYTTYDGLLGVLNSGDFNSRVISMKTDPVLGMPPDRATGGPKDLTEEELNIISCWLEAGFPEN